VNTEREIRERLESLSRADKYRLLFLTEFLAWQDGPLPWLPFPAGLWRAICTLFGACLYARWRGISEAWLLIALRF